MENKKIKNAKKDFYDNIQFKSHLEVVIYKTLKEFGFEPLYEFKKFIIWEGYRPNVLFFNRITKKKNKITKKNNISFQLCNQKVRDITYTPDFYMIVDKLHVIIETKGHENDVFPLKRKLFRKYLEKQKGNFIYFEVHSKGEILKAIQIINNLIKIIKMLEKIKKLIDNLFPKDVDLARSFIQKRKFEDLQELVLSTIVKLERKKDSLNETELEQLTKLQELNGYLVEYNRLLGNEQINYADCFIEDAIESGEFDDDI